jgi:hypothetical protein
VHEEFVQANNLTDVIDLPTVPNDTDTENAIFYLIYINPIITFVYCVKKFTICIFINTVVIIVNFFIYHG